jgi:hypothetical protein
VEKNEEIARSPVEDPIVLTPIVASELPQLPSDL